MSSRVCAVRWLDRPVDEVRQCAWVAGSCSHSLRPARVSSALALAPAAAAAAARPPRPASVLQLGRRRGVEGDALQADWRGSTPESSHTGGQRAAHRREQRGEVVVAGRALVGATTGWDGHRREQRGKVLPVEVPSNLVTPLDLLLGSWICCCGS